MGTNGQGDPDRTELLATRTPSGVAGTDDVLPPNTPLGRYRVQALLGRGGMGEVYRAEQVEPVRRTVALKLLRGRMLDARHKAYFEVERQVLAQMRHPAIAQIHDADTTPDGQPFFAMEFIDGQPITGYCQSRALPLARRIELFIEVCEGVQHAHQKGVIHRDLKPGNLLVEEVDGRAHPKIIDFGIATASSLGGGREIAGTPDYMSPEQADGDQALMDTRSDVYSLGVVLCELLTGQRPAAAGETVTDHSRTFRLPSEQLATLPPGVADRVARGLGQPLPAVARVLRSELDWIVLKAMRHDRAERYPSASALAEDLRRFLDGRAVQAVPASRLYALRKFAARRRGALAAAAVAVAALVGGLAMSLHGLQQARAQRAIAEQRSAELEKVAAFQQSMLENIDLRGMGLGLADGLRGQLQRTDPALLADLEAVLGRVSTTDLARAVIERDILVRAEEAIASDFSDQPALAADLSEATGRVYQALGLYDRAATILGGVAEVREGLLGERDPATLRARLGEAEALRSLSQYDQALEKLEAAQADAADLPGDDEVRVGIGTALCETRGLKGDLQAARECRQRLLDRLTALRGDEDPMVLQLMMNQAQGIARMGDVPEARVLMEHVVEVFVRLRGEEHRSTQTAMASLATMHALLSDFEPAVAMQRKVVEGLIARLGRDHPSTLAARGNLTNMLSDMGRTEEALAEGEVLMAARIRVFGPEHPETLRGALNQAAFHGRLDDFDKALPLERQVLEARRRILGPDHPDTLFMQLNHGLTLQRAGRSGEALEILGDALPRAQAVLGEKHRQYQAGLLMSGEAMLRTGRVDAGIDAMRRALALRKAHLPADAPEIPATAWSLVQALHQAGRDAEAAQLRRQELDPLLAADPDTLGATLRKRRDSIEREMREEGMPRSL